jgi:hypothetical protein
VIETIDNSCILNLYLQHLRYSVGSGPLLGGLGRIADGVKQIDHAI